MKIAIEKYDQAMFLKERALEIVGRHGVIERIQNAGFGRICKRQWFSIWYADPETAECDEYNHLDIHANGRGKVFSVMWKGAQPLEVVTFKRGSWEEYFLT